MERWKSLAWLLLVTLAVAASARMQPPELAQDERGRTPMSLHTVEHDEDARGERPRTREVIAAAQIASAEADALLSRAGELQLTPEQQRRLRAIQLRARREAHQVLTPQQQQRARRPSEAAR